MKYKLIGVVSFVVVFILSILASIFTMSDDGKVVRYHQHLEQNQYVPCTNHADDVFCSHLPIVVIETGGKVMPGEVTDQTDIFNEHLYSLTENGETAERMTIKIFDKENENNHLLDKPSIHNEVLIRKRGHSSRRFEKAPYQFKFVDNTGIEVDIPVMGMPAHNEWVLNGPYLDKSLVRNYMFYNISGEMMDYAPNVRYCELFLDGDYRGIYLMCESVTSGDDSRLDLTVTEKDNTLTGYLLRMDRPVEEDMNTVRNIYTMGERQNYVGDDVIIKYPGKNKLTADMAKNIELEFSQFDKAIYSYDYDSEKYGYTTYIDVDNFVDYFIINEFTKNLDAGAYSTYIYKRPTEKYKMCVWDFNNACDNYPEDWVGFMGFSMHNTAYYIPLCRDEDFINAVIDRYFELRKTYLSDEYLIEYVDDTIEFLGPAVQRDENRWRGYIQSDTLLQPDRKNAHTHMEAATDLKNWLLRRTKWLDENIDSLKQYSAESKVKKYNEVTE